MSDVLTSKEKIYQKALEQIESTICANDFRAGVSAMQITASKALAAAERLPPETKAPRGLLQEARALLHDASAEGGEYQIANWMAKARACVNAIDASSAETTAKAVDDPISEIWRCQREIDALQARIKSAEGRIK